MFSFCQPQRNQSLLIFRIYRHKINTIKISVKFRLRNNVVAVHIRILASHVGLGVSKALVTAVLLELAVTPTLRLLDMATPVILGVSAIAAAVLGRSLIQRGLFVGKGAAEQWVKGGFRNKMDRKEAIAILGLK